MFVGLMSHRDITSPIIRRSHRIKMNGELWLLSNPNPYLASRLPLDGEPRDGEVHPSAGERHSFGLEESALALADSE